MFPHRARVKPGGAAFYTGNHLVRFIGANGINFGFAVETRHTDKGSDPDVTTANLTAEAGETLLVPWLKYKGGLVMLTVEDVDGDEVRVIVTKASPKLDALLGRAVDVVGDDAAKFIKNSAEVVGAKVDDPAAVGEAMATGAQVEGGGIEAGLGAPPRRRKKDRRPRPTPANQVSDDDHEDGGCPGCPSCGSVANIRDKGDGMIRVTIPRHIRRIMRMGLGKLSEEASHDVFSGDRIAANIGLATNGDTCAKIMRACAECAEYIPV